MRCQHPLDGGGVYCQSPLVAFTRASAARLPCSSDLNSGNKNNSPGFTSNDNKRPGTNNAQALNSADHIKGSALYCTIVGMTTPSPQVCFQAKETQMEVKGLDAECTCTSLILTQFVVFTLASCTHSTSKQPRRHRTESIRQTKLIVPSSCKAGTEQSYPSQAYASLNPHGSSYAMLPSAL